MTAECLKTLVRRLSGLSGIFQSFEHISTEYATINLLNAWSEYCGDLLVYSYNGGFITTTGTPVAPRPPKSKEQIAQELRARFGRGRGSWHPSWHSPDQFRNFARHLSLQNQRELVAAMGSNINPVVDVRVLRNFFAHKGQNTYQQVCDKVGPVNPVQYVQDYIGAARRWENWIFNFSTTAVATLE